MGKITLGCFGKLPIHSDFIRFRASGEDVLALDQWLQEGIQTAQTRWGREWKTYYSQADPWNFVFQVKGGDGFLVGLLVPSHDQAGRCYPFLLFLRVPRNGFAAPIQFAPLTFRTFLKEAAEWAQSGSAGKNVKAFLNHFETWNPSVPDDPSGRSDEAAYRRFLKEERSEAFWMKLCGASVDSAPHRIVENLQGVLEPMRRTSLTPPRFALTFSLVPADKNCQEDIPFWSDLTARLLKRPWAAEPNFFWNRLPAKGPPRMVLFPGPPPAKSFFALIAPDMDNETVYDLAAVAAATEPKRVKEETPSRSEPPSIVETDKMSLEAFLEAL